MNNTKKNFNSAQLIKKARNYCVYRERCHREVLCKLLEWGASPELSEEGLSDLITSRYVNEERYAQIYANSKFRKKKRGKVQIKLGLPKRNIRAYCISKGMEEIEEDDYLKTLQFLVERKNEEYISEDQAFPNKKIARYCVHKGFESNRVWDEIKRILS